MNGLLSMLFAFSIINPIDAFLPLKVPLFALLLFFCIFHYQLVPWNSIMICTTVYFVLILTSFIGFLMNYETDYSISLFYYKTFAFLLLIPWCRFFYVFKCTIYSLLVVATICIGIYIIFMTDEMIFKIIYNFLEQEMKGLMSISKRTFIGVDFSSVCYSSTCIALVVFPYLLSIWFSTKEKRIGFFCIILGILIFISGLRAIMLAGGLTLVGVCLMELYKKSKLAAISFFLILSIVGLRLIIALLNDEGEISLDIKTTLAKAFFNHINNNPETLIWGNGVGATFDSLGVRGKNAIASELFYYEIIRFFGLPLGGMFLFVYIYPLYLIYKKKQTLIHWKAISLGYLSYLFAGGTNPYLTSSNGMITLLIMYSYAYNSYYQTSYKS